MRKRLGLGLGFGLAVLLAAAWDGSAPARAFELPVHERIVIEGLSGRMSGAAFNRVIAGNKESDIHQMAPERHFDSAQNPAEVCAEWGKGFQKFLTEAVKQAAPKGDWQDELEDREDALFAFGAASHSIQDFYSHSNWIELHSAGKWDGMPPAAPLVGVTCDPAAFPPELNTGYASVLWFIAQFGRSWCGPLGQPDGFADCHDTLAKDDPEHGHGAQQIGMEDGAPTYHAVAVELAKTGTRQAWDELHRRVVAAYDSEETDGECVFRKLAWGGRESCRRSFRLTGPVEADVEWSGTVTDHQRYRGDLDVTFRTLADGTITGSGTAAMRFSGESQTRGAHCTESGSGTVPVRVTGTWTRGEQDGRTLTLRFESATEWTNTRTCVTPNGTVTFPIQALMITPNAGAALPAVRDGAEMLPDRYEITAASLHGVMTFRWGRLQLRLPLGS